ncbi:hypothetical protein SLEP1_g47301 [Rubroshorea leprosula]|uniref:Uncharacterized protein n=1 Tax=Rubroshorea leprosula TaxID=152421 RepID=A0AAV5LRV6_9ROSI|nr:hypothetical protein SLEP1_g47301 [Rubroshorea leprosula]
MNSTSCPFPLPKNMDEANQVQEAAAALIAMQAAATLLAMHAGGAPVGNTQPVAAHAPQSDNLAPVRRSPRLTARTVDVDAPPRVTDNLPPIRRSARLAAMAANHNSNSENS